ncbi:acyl-CoA reductase-like NAD-dependent aldehyde dehydrogenase [Streptomyces griseochromogenes]|uniref:Acyl-CoA reductase-like NAD-dependent aldehyde dehydrogenase n=1 Tax=Streptomyces griseochromogenes TaxID=68214 RepID=A0ABS4M4Y9_9ACTN|nr:succinic semialdehyde dehydrogenase [Streptomyces griseochromogenes]MBP2054746.1 acyl-CoA reductase-like NAD-dependent aldehyde dehydrogenase [Streptomyces griseochromogenes]
MTPSTSRAPLVRTTARLAAQLSGGGPELRPRAPFTLDVIARLPGATAEDVARAFERARAAQPDWAARPAPHRARIAGRLHGLLLGRRHEALDLLQWETGKARVHAFDEVIDAAGVCRYYARRAPGLLAPRRRAGVLPPLTSVRELRHPKGVVAVITPWNYPLSLTVTDVVPALLAGNAVVQKADTQTACTTLWAREQCVRAGLPAELWQIVVGEPAELGPALLAGADHLAFTGSTAAGRELGGLAGERLIGCMLELGGKNPLLVLADADLDRAAAGAVRACFSSAGQLCMSAERILVDQRVHDRFVARFLRRVAALRLSAGFDFGGDLGSLTSHRQLDRVRTHVTDALAKGARLLCGGRERPDIGPLFYAPTVLAGVTPEMTLYREETFGPVVRVGAFRDEEEAVALANDSPYGLNASVWSRSPARARALGTRLRVGAVNINEGFRAAYVSYDAPSGGRQESGIGHRHGATGLLQYTDCQVLARTRANFFDPRPGTGAERHTELLTTLARTMTRLGLG